MPIEDISTDFATGFDDIREELLGCDAKLVLLQEDGTTKAFNQIQVLKQAWYSEYSMFYTNSVFHVADLSSLTGSNIRKATHLVMVDSNLDAQNNVLYEIKSDTVPPDSNVPWWKVIAASLSRKYIAPEEI
jgi:hypothetical protein